MTNIRSSRSSALAALLDDPDGPARQGGRQEPQQTRAPVSQRGGAGPDAGPRRALGPVVRAVDVWAVGDPVLVQPEGVVVRWPQGEPPPSPGDSFEGRSVHVTRPEHRAALRTLLRGNVLERCEATEHLPPRLLTVFYSPSQWRNMRRVARNLCPSLKQHVAGVLARGLRVSSKVLIKVAARSGEAAQWAEWRASLA